jgi:predicted nucleic acid-binding protein
MELTEGQKQRRAGPLALREESDSRQLGVAQVWASLTTAAQQRGRPRPLHDTWIAACCIEGELPLLTLNRRDFAGFAEHDGLVLFNP